jgi:hypothetical protein
MLTIQQICQELNYSETVNGDLIEITFDNVILLEENNNALLNKIHQDIVKTLKKLRIDTEKVILENPCSYFFNDEDDLVKISFLLDILTEEEDIISHTLEIFYEGEEIELYTIEYIGE